MIQDTIKIHDQYQFEIKLGYGLEKGYKNTNYAIETYIFIPKSIHINRYTYTKNDFYNDIKSYIRLKTPAIPLKELITGDNSPLKKLGKQLAEATKEPSESSFLNYEQELKLFCCISKSSLRDHLILLSKSNSSLETENLVKEYISSIKKIHEGFKKLKTAFITTAILKDIAALYNFADEYLSILIEAHTYHLLKKVKKNNVSLKKYKPALFEIIKNELNHRQEHNYRSIPEENTDNEEMLFRASVLKKYMSNILFLDTHVQQEGKIIEQFFLGLIAGLSMIMATAIAFLSQHKYGALTFQFFLALIISYMFKDRIKEILRYYISGHLKKLFFDYKVKIFSNHKHIIGLCKESFNFVKEQKTEKQIVKIRNIDHITELENERVGEKIILYRKRIKIYAKKLQKIYPDSAVQGITDILRFNITKFINKMDNPLKALHILKENEYKKIYGQRVYHLNMVLKYSTNKNSFYKRFRIILNRNGIKRIEKVPLEAEKSELV